jgi:hypothetical protein
MGEGPFVEDRPLSAEPSPRGWTIRLHVRRRVKPSDPAAGYGLIKVKPRAPGSKPRRLSEFDPAALLKRRCAKEYDGRL